MSQNFTNRPGDRGMRMVERLRFGIKDLWKRRTMTTFNVAAVLVAVIYVLLPAFYGLSIYRYQRSVLDESLPTRIVASCPDVTNERLRFTNQQICKLVGLPETKLLFPKVELGVKLSLDSRSNIDLPIEATVPNDPALSATRLVWGRPVQGAELRQVVVPKSLFEKLGGNLGESGPIPSALSVQVSRTVSGHVQNQTIPLQVVGVLRHQSFDKVYAPLELVEQLDQWCSNKIDTIGNEPEQPSVDYPYCFVYVPQAERHRIEAEAKQLRVDLQLEGELTVYDAPADVWLAIDIDPAGAEGLKILKNIEASGADVFSVRTLTWQTAGHTFMASALPPGDPRWRHTTTGHPPGFGEAFARPGLDPQFTGSIGEARVVGSFNGPGTGDLYCTQETLQWLAFASETAPCIDRMTLVETDNLDLAQRWDQTISGCVTPDRETCWGIYELHECRPAFGDVGQHTTLDDTPSNVPDSLTASVQPAPPQTVSRNHPADELLSMFRLAAPNVSCGVTYTDSVRLSELPLDSTVVCRFIPDQLFHQLTAEQTQRISSNEEAIPCIQVGSDQRITLRTVHRVGKSRLTLSGVLSGSNRMLFFPMSVRQFLCPGANQSGVACWADWRRGGVIDRFFAQQRDTVSPLHWSCPSVFSLVYEGGLESARRWLDDDGRHCLLTEVISVAVKVDGEGQAVATICATPTRSEEFHGNRCALPTAVGSPCQASIEAGNFRHQVRLQHSNRLPRGVAIVDGAMFRRLAFETAIAGHGLANVGRPTTNIRVASIHYKRIRQELETNGLPVTPLVPIREQTLLKFKVTDSEQPDEKVGEDLIRVLSMSKPTIAAVVPAMPTQAMLAGEITLDASTPTDPRRFESQLACGKWLTGNALNEIVLPATKAEQLWHRQLPRDGTDTFVEVQFDRSKRIAVAEPALKLPLRVVGVVASDTAVVPPELLQQIALWKDGKVVYQESKNAFESPSAIYTRCGHIRCNLHARDLMSVEPLVTKLRQMGYQTEDSLADQQGLRRLGQALTLVVVTFALGCLLIACKMIVVTAMMNVYTKRWEIGLLKAHGMSTRCILSIFAMQGAVIGTGAFVVGSVMVTAFEPAVRSWIGTSFRIPMDSIITGSLMSAESAWLLLVAFVVALVMSTLGVMLPAARAAGQLPVDTLQRRE